MKHIAIWLIKQYQKIPGDFHNACKYRPTCSNYAIEAYEEFGFFYGTFSKGGYDPVPKRRKK